MDITSLCRLDSQETVMKRGFWIAITFSLIFSLTPPINAQNTAQDTDRTDVFAPFVSRLRVAVRDPQVRLTWRDAEDLENGTYEIYRHTSEINQDSIDEATLVATVEAGTETYLDTPLVEGNYFYAVLARSSEGESYRIFVPFRNVTIRSVTVQQLETEEDLAASIYDISTQIQDDAVIVRFDPSRSGRNLIVYRSTVPFTQETDLTAVTRLDQFDSTTRRFADYPVPGIDYYYAVLDSILVQNGTYTIQSGENTTAAPVRISISGVESIRVEVPAADARKTPLPFLHLSSGIRPGTSVTPGLVSASINAQPVSLATQEAIDFLLAFAPESSTFQPEPIILSEERGAGTQGAEQTLSQVVLGEFSEARYVEAVDLFRNILLLPLEKELETRVRFYLAQALYFSGEKEAAFMEFLLTSRSGYYQEAKPWMDGILTG